MRNVSFFVFIETQSRRSASITVSIGEANGMRTDSFVYQLIDRLANTLDKHVMKELDTSQFHSNTVDIETNDIYSTTPIKSIIDNLAF